ncbi:hypothetical protein EJ05DRAFT_96618 [Pseudovirgaria hyperparasitica]|uniref:Peptidase C14 caspase domain-containing protein n=1 Tax=Pseudovirgaria hyperparasitica TaxID=470096 RepID=A0A6A6W045_9PEZI|nr:uncharacterized protein EJ05DRAFT_96618 [Pseudovirgaria hyperparasitica]KAF2756298.1 hypothetical protein EJ05DRAFT_96618 [Pseudovirgaria hyperparasitica]
MAHIQDFTGPAIIHADVHSIEPDNDAVQEMAAQNFTHDLAHSSEDKKIADQMSNWWEDAMRTNMNVQDNYNEVHVLMIKWARHIDQLKTHSEVERLSAVFRDDFNYSVEKVELDNRFRKPQHQLNSAIAKFVEKHNDPRNLLIVYYTGHGSWNKDQKYLELSATNNDLKNKFSLKAKANFNTAEAFLKSDVDADVLTILDTCFSSNMQKSGGDNERAYQLLSASGFDQTTTAGEESFTSTLILTLKELVKQYENKRSFSTHTLVEKINMNPVRRDSPCFLWNRLSGGDRFIRLQPLDKKEDHIELHQVGLKEPVRGYLTLRFALKSETLNRDQIEFLTQQFSQIFAKGSKVRVDRIDWLGIRKTSRHAFLAVQVIKKWRKLAERSSKRKLNVDTEDVDMGEDEESSSPRKKGRSAASTSLAQAGINSDPLTPNSLDANS